MLCGKVSGTALQENLAGGLSILIRSSQQPWSYPARQITKIGFHSREVREQEVT